MSLYFLGYNPTLNRRSLSFDPVMQAKPLCLYPRIKIFFFKSSVQNQTENYNNSSERSCNCTISLSLFHSEMREREVSLQKLTSRNWIISNPYEKPLFLCEKFNINLSLFDGGGGGRCWWSGVGGGGSG